MVLQFPNINLNGAEGMDLATQYHEAAQAIEVAVNLMGRIVHGRDYQGLLDGSYTCAREQMMNRIKPMIEAFNDLNQIAQHCAENAR